MDKRPRLVYEFGPFRLDMEQRILSREGALVSLAPKVLDTLVVLVQNRGRILEKEELVQTLWPESFVEESNLSQNIFVLRKMLGDDRNASAFIQTIPRRGYRFVAEVKESETTTSALAVPTSDYWNRHSPFRSLQVFETEDAWLFFGRDTETADLLIRLEQSPVLAIVGNSGCGKSSLVRAGMIPELRAGRFCDHGTAVHSWRIAVFRPSAAPFDYLAEVLPKQLAPELSLKEQADFIEDCRSKLPAGGNSLRNAVSALVNATAGKTGETHVLLVADQFEEIFTLTSSPQVRERYMDALLAASRVDSAVPVHVVLVLRADFYAHCLDHPELSRCLEANLYNVPRMTQEQLRESIEKRLELAAAPPETGLINALLEDVGAEPGNLALLEHALGQLWDKCGGSGRTLTNRAYAEIGRLRGALGRHADAVYESMRDEDQKRLAQKIFLELVHLGEGAQDTRRRVPKSDLHALGDAENVEPLLVRLIASRLISTGLEGHETFVEVSHEALIREWPALREWLLENREELRFERRLHQGAEEWQALHRDSGALLQGPRLAQGEEWLAQHPNAPPLLREFLEASVEMRAEARERELTRQKELRIQAEARAQAERELREQQASNALQARRSASRLRRLSYALAGLMMVAIAVAVLAYREQRIERSHALSAQSGELLARDHGQALALAISSWQTAKTEEARLSVAQAFPDLLAIMTHDGPVQSVAFSPDGLRIASASDDHTAKLWDPVDGRLIATLKGHTDRVLCVAFSSDGRRVLTAGNDDTVRVWNSIDGSLLQTLTGQKAQIDRFAVSRDARAAFSPDGKRIVSSGREEIARVWDAGNGHLLTTLQGHTGIVTDAAFSPDGKHIVTASWDLTARVWNSSNGRLESTLSGHTQMLPHVEFSPDGRQIVTTSWDHTARIWSSDGRLLSILHHDGPVEVARFSADGTLIATASQDHTARVFSATDGRPLFTLQHDGPVEDAVFSHDGRSILTAGDDTARLWSSATGRVLAMLNAADTVHAVAFSPDGKSLVTAGDDHTLRLWNTASGLLVTTLQGHKGYLIRAEFSHDGQRILTISQDLTARVWNSDTGRLLLTLQGGERGFSQASFSPDDKKIVTGNGVGTAQVWDSANGRVLATLQGHTASIRQVQFSSDGQHIVTASTDHTARIWDVTGRQLAVLSGHVGTVVYAEFSPDGRYIVTASNDHTARVWNSADGQALAVLQGHTDVVWRARFSPDGRRIVTASFDHTGRLWDSSNGNLIATLTGHSDILNAAEFSPDGRTILTASWDHTAKVWTAIDGSLLATLQGHTGKVIDAAFSRDGRYIVTAGEDRTARVWKTDDDHLLAILRGHTGDLWQAAFSPDSQHIVTVSLDQTARVWRVVTLRDIEAILEK